MDLAADNVVTPYLIPIAVSLGTELRFAVCDACVLRVVAGASLLGRLAEVANGSVLHDRRQRVHICP